MGPETSAAYETGNGSVLLRATAHVEYEGSKRKRKRGATAAQDAAAAEEADAAAAAAGGKALIVFTEMPYQVCKVGSCQRSLPWSRFNMFVEQQSWAVFVAVKHVCDRGMCDSAADSMPGCPLLLALMLCLCSLIWCSALLSWLMPSSWMASLMYAMRATEQVSALPQPQEGFATSYGLFLCPQRALPQMFLGVAE